VDETPAAQVPDGWKQPEPDLPAMAKEKALKALKQTGTDPAQERLAWFYDTHGDYAGATFAQLQPIDPWNLTSTDLHAATFLSIRIGPRATRRIADQCATRDDLLCKLAEVPELDLAAAGSPELLAMADLYEAVKKALSADGVKRPNAWVTAGKLCARKRPGLFPVRDRKVCRYLGLTPAANYQVDWQIFRSLVTDRDIVAAIDGLTEATLAGAADRHLRLDDSPLRLLDAAIWTYAISLGELQNHRRTVPIALHVSRQIPPSLEGKRSR
jgi:hypothetical protein